jgi:predicted outer membrane repeat protein
MARQTRRAVLAAALAFSGAVATFGLAATTARADSTVLYAAPSAVGSGDCSSAANACTLSTALSDSGTGDTIELASGTFDGAWNITDAVTLEGRSQSATLLDGESRATVLDSDPAGGTVSLEALTIEHGAGSTGFTGESGGGVEAMAGSLDVTDCTFSGNDATESGGAIDFGDDLAGGSLVVTDSTFSHNTAGSGGTGGAIANGGDNGSGTVTISGSTFTSNSAGYNGGAIANGGFNGSGTVTISGSTFTSNSAGYDAGAVDNGDDSGSGTVTISSSAFSSNSAEHDGGAVDNGDSDGRGTLTVSGSTFSSNNASYDDGAIGNGNGDSKGATLTVSGSSFSSNTSSISGGAIGTGGNGGSGTASVSSSAFTANKATGEDGGAIDNGDGGSGSLTVTDSTFAGNDTGVAGDGGAIDNADLRGSGSLTISDSTFAGNDAGSFGNGGGIDNGDSDGSGTAAVTSSTFDGNGAGGGGDISNSGSESLALAADIVAAATSGSDCRGAITDDGYNISDDASCGLSSADGSVSDSSVVDSYLGTLGDHGGTTETIPLLSSDSAPASSDPASGPVSPAADTLVATGSVVEKTATTVCSTPDERGDAREASGCDMGAWGGWSRVSLTVSDKEPVSGQEVTYTAKVATGESRFAGPVEFSLDHAGTEPAHCRAGSQRFNPTTHVATCEIVWPNAGDVALFASWPGDSTEPLALTSKVVKVARASASIVLTSPTPDPSAPGIPLVLRAAVSVDAPGSTGVSGTVRFTDSASSKALCHARLSHSIATCTAAIPVGKSQQITASYGGSANLKGSKTTLPHHVEEGYWTLSKSGAVTAHGNAQSYGSLGKGLAAVGIASTPDGKGYWIAEPDGKVVPFGDATALGSPPQKSLKSPVVGIVSAPAGDGYLLVTSLGAVYAFGDLHGHGSPAPKSATSPVVAVALTPDAKGHYLVERDGSVLGFGDATVHGSSKAPASDPVTGIAAASDDGYWVVEQSGAVEHFGSAEGYGSVSAPQRTVAIEATADHLGYFVAERNGVVRGKGDASPGKATTTSERIVGFAEM